MPPAALRGRSPRSRGAGVAALAGLTPDPSTGSVTGYAGVKGWVLARSPCGGCGLCSRPWRAALDPRCASAHPGPLVAVAVVLVGSGWARLVLVRGLCLGLGPQARTHGLGFALLGLLDLPGHAGGFLA